MAFIVIDFPAGVAGHDLSYNKLCCHKIFGKFNIRLVSLGLVEDTGPYIAMGFSLFMYYVNDASFLEY